MTDTRTSPDNAQCQNTDRHLWPQVSEEENAPRLFATAGGGIGIDVGGQVIVKPLRDWHTLASINAQGRVNPAEDWSCVADFLDDIHIDDKGMCRWADVANAQTHIRHTMRSVERQPSKGYEAALANLREAWAALSMIRETVETLAPSGAVKAAEHLDGPTFTHEADALVEGIIAIASTLTSTGCEIPSSALAATPEEIAHAKTLIGQDLYRWPIGCHSPNSCHRNGRCMYVGCKHDGKDIKALAVTQQQRGEGQS